MRFSRLSSIATGAIGNYEEHLRFAFAFVSALALAYRRKDERHTEHKKDEARVLWEKRSVHLGMHPWDK